MSEHNAVVRVYNAHPEAEAAVKVLQRSGFDMQKLSIVGKDYHTEEHVIGYDNAGDRMGSAPYNAVQGKIASVPRYRDTTTGAMAGHLSSLIRPQIERGPPGWLPPSASSRGPGSSRGAGACAPDIVPGGPGVPPVAP